VNPTVKGNLIQLCKLVAVLLLCALQVTFLFEVMPYGGLYIGLLSLVLDLSVYCWLASGAYRALTRPRARRKASAQLGARARNLLPD
jgi:hypothetical protein